MFLNKKLLDAKKKYWFTKMKIVDVIWIVKKVRYFIESCKQSFTLIFIDHSVTIELINQTSLFTFNTDKFNLRLIRVFQYFFTLLIRIRIKSERFHVISDALSRLNTKVFNDNSSILKNINDVNFMFFKAISRKKISRWNVKFQFVNEILNVHFEKRIFFNKNERKFRQNFEKSLWDKWSMKKNEYQIENSRE